jgi:NAD(P)-dependent dehydrogenase (short-subunit alcohol dehydrogenase family)
VNSVSPGFLPTKLGESITNKESAGLLMDREAWTEYEKRQGRVAHPDEVGDVVVLLSTPRMSLVNGKTRSALLLD